MVGDDDGVVVIPRAMLGRVVEDVSLKEDREEFIRMKLAAGAPLDGLYPTSPETEQEFRRWRVAHKQVESAAPVVSEQERYAVFRENAVSSHACNAESALWVRSPARSSGR